MSKQTAMSIIVVGIIVAIIATTPQMAYAWTLKVDVSKSEFGVERCKCGN